MNLCQKCKTLKESGVNLDFMAYDEGPLYFSHYEGAATVSKKKLSNFYPFSVWLCIDCIRQEKKKMWKILLFLGLFLISLLLFSVVPDNLKFFTGVFAFLFFSGILYCTFLFFKPYRSLSDEDLSFLFTDTIGQVRNTTGRAKHMLLKEFCASYDPAKSPHQGYPAYTAAQQGLQSPYSKQKLKMQANQPIDYMSADKRAELIGILMNENPEWSYAFAEKTANIMISNGYHF